VTAAVVFHTKSDAARIPSAPPGPVGSANLATDLLRTVFISGLIGGACAVVPLMAGCAKDAETKERLTEPAPCSPGHAQPISEATLKAVFAQRGIQLRRDDRCETFRNPTTQRLDPRAPLVTLSNTSGAADYDQVVSTQGDIFCQLERKNSFGRKLERLKYEGDEETHLRTLNVLCTIYPEAPEQINALAAALLQLPGVRA
jgi:hypothetical protein